MENHQNENFEQLQRLMRLKCHETPPPGYFNRFSRDVISGIRAQRNQAKAGPLTRLESEAPWLMRLWRSPEARPAFAGAFGATICAVIIGGIVLVEKPADTGAGLAIAPAEAGNPFLASGLVATTDSSAQSMVLAGSNAPVRNLFELIEPGQTMPAGFSPAGN